MDKKETVHGQRELGEKIPFLPILWVNTASAVLTLHRRQPAANDLKED